MKLSRVSIFGEWARMSFSDFKALFMYADLKNPFDPVSPRPGSACHKIVLSSMMNESTTFRYSFSLSLRPWSVMSKDFVLILCFTSLRVSMTVVVLLPRQVK